jgi:hypothetical protein
VHTVGTADTFATIADAVASATVLSGDTLLLAGEVFAEEVVIDNKDLTLIGTTGTEIVASADGPDAEAMRVLGGFTVVLRHVALSHTGDTSGLFHVDTGSTLEVFGALLGPSNGVGVHAVAGSSVTVESSRISQNAGGGLDLAGDYVVQNTALVQNGSNTSTVGGALLASAGTFDFNTLTGNQADDAVAAGVSCGVPQAVAHSIVFNNASAAGQLDANCNRLTSLVGLNPSFAADLVHVLATSVALNQVPAGDCIATDIDGQARPMDGSCDVGADERPRDP